MKNPIISARLKRRALAQQLSEADNYIVLSQIKNKIRCTSLDKNSLGLMASFIIENDYAKAFIFEFIKQHEQITNEQSNDNSAAPGADRNKATTDNQP